MGLKSFRTALLLGAAAMGMTAASAALAPAYAQEATRTFAIEPQELDEALREFGRQSGRDILFAPDAVAGKRSPGVEGQMTERHALEALLAGTGLRFEQTASNGYAVQDPNSPTQLGDARRSEAAPSDGNVNEEIVVVGTRIRGVYPESSPVDVYTQQDIGRSGATTTQEFMERLPQNLAFTSDNAPATVIGVADANREAVNSPDLRGLGVGTTLTLLNGRRLGLANLGRGADVSTIPVSAVARVEVLTDGASAIYGSDAIGGVVNFVLRDDFEGAETRIRYGAVTDGGLRQGGLSQMFGRSWADGHALINYDFHSASALESSDRPQLFNADSIAETNLTPVEQRHSLLAFGSQDLGEDLSIEGLVAWSLRSVKNRTATSSLTARNYAASETEQLFANVAATYRFSPGLTGEVNATFTDVAVDSDFVRSTPFSLTSDDSNHSAWNLTATLDGPLFSLPGGQLRYVVGADYVDEEYVAQRSALTGDVGRATPLGRATTAAFFELFAPLVSEEQNLPFFRRLELSLAGRYTSHEDNSSPPLDGDFEGFSPKVGLLWSPFTSLSLRGTWGESFRAPTISQTDPTGGISYLPGNFPIGGVQSAYLVLDGPARNLQPETAETYTLGFDYRPRRQPGFRFSATYYNISYVDRIRPAGIPAGSFADPHLWSEIWFQPASAGEIEAFFADYPLIFNASDVPTSDPATLAQALYDRLPEFWVADARIRNLSLSEQDGFDLSLSNTAQTGWGEIFFGATLSRMLNYRQQLSPNSPAISVLDTVLNPVDLRGRMFLGVSRDWFTTTVNVNYVDDYTNPYARDAGSPRTVDSWTTVDWNTGVDFSDNSAGAFGGFRISLSVQNLFDEDPPFVYRTANGPSNLVFSPGYDPANANPLGRFISLEIAKAW